MSKARMLVVALIVLVGGVVAFAVHSLTAKDIAMPQVGQQAPTFVLPSQDGTQISLDSFKGKWVVLYFYPKDMSSGCTLEAHNFQRDQDKFTKQNAVIVGISVDTAESHKQFCTKENLTFRLLADPSAGAVIAYGSLASLGPLKIAKRNTFLIDPTGKIVKVWTGVKSQTHSQEVVAELATVEQKGM
ncbi:peroxiredoxin [Granulicella sp. L60]|uniref:peroxiredoxin n=1 Tax=Granulicella sp. L60 TaxID=1641866 RepID=UPI00131AF8CA|nr:redoxin domain-containing protein [Granulicella sp. L60]